MPSNSESDMAPNTHVEEFFVLKFDASGHKSRAGKFVDLDRPSGGYPYAVDLLSRAHRWPTAEQALNYADMFAPPRSSTTSPIEKHAYPAKLTVEIKEN